MTNFSPVQFVDADAQRIQDDLIEAYEKATDTYLYPGDPRRVFLLQLLPALVALKNDLNYTGNQNLLPFAEDDVLDALGERIGVRRLDAQQAIVTMRFTLSAAQQNQITVPAGTLVTPDGLLYFFTTEELKIEAGSLTGDVLAMSTEGGEKYNGFLPGQISSIVQPIPFVASATNIDESRDGANKESDDAYRERQRLAPASFSVAGPTNAYAFFAKSADVNIVDVAVTSPNPVEVDIHVLLKNGEAPDQTVLDKVLAQVNADDRRPLTDLVRVFARDSVNYDIDVTYYISSERSNEVSAIRTAIEGSGGAVDDYVQWQYAKLGRAITPDELQSRMYQAGAYRVVVTSPVYTEINATEVALLNTKNIVYGGLI